MGAGKQRRSGAGAIAAMALSCVFGAAMLLSLAAGAGVYRRVAERVDRAANGRVGLTYITAKMHSYDAAGKIESGTFGGGDAIFLLQDVGGQTYETILYVYDGQLMEMLCRRGWEPEPSGGQAITDARSLTVAEPSPGLLRLTFENADGTVQRSDIELRSD